MNKHTLALLPLLAAGVSLASPLPSSAEKRAVNTVNADYVNKIVIPCPKHKNGSCSADCKSKATEVYVFSVTGNVSYQKFGVYGDRKLEKGNTVLVDTTKPIPGQDDVTVLAKMSELQYGDHVSFTLTHFYMDDHGIQSSSRAITSFQLVQAAGKPKPADSSEAPSEDDDVPSSSDDDDVPSSADDDTPSSSDDDDVPSSSDDDETPSSDEPSGDDEPSTDETPSEDDGDTTEEPTAEPVVEPTVDETPDSGDDEEEDEDDDE